MPWALAKRVLVMILPFLSDETLCLLLDLILPSLLALHNQPLQLLQAKLHRTGIDGHSLLNKTSTGVLRAQLSQ
jgi:hypothetical protein